MRVIKTMRPGERGTARHQRRYGERLCAVRYRKSDCGSRIVTTVEIIVDDRAAAPAGVCHNAVNARQRAQPVAIKIAYDEIELRRLAKQAGARWSRSGRAWVMRRDTAVGLGLLHRVDGKLLASCTDIDTSFEIN